MIERIVLKVFVLVLDVSEGMGRKGEEGRGRGRDGGICFFFSGERTEEGTTNERQVPRALVTGGCKRTVNLAILSSTVEEHVTKLHQNNYSGDPKNRKASCVAQSEQEVNNSIHNEVGERMVSGHSFQLNSRSWALQI